MRWSIYYVCNRPNTIPCGGSQFLLWPSSFHYCRVALIQSFTSEQYCWRIARKPENKSLQIATFIRCVHQKTKHATCTVEMEVLENLVPKVRPILWVLPILLQQWWVLGVSFSCQFTARIVHHKWNCNGFKKRSKEMTRHEDRNKKTKQWHRCKIIDQIETQYLLNGCT